MGLGFLIPYSSEICFASKMRMPWKRNHFQCHQCGSTSILFVRLLLLLIQAPMGDSQCSDGMQMNVCLLWWGWVQLNLSSALWACCFGFAKAWLFLYRAWQDMSRQPPTQELVANDLHGNEWRFRHIFRGKYWMDICSYFITVSLLYIHIIGSCLPFEISSFQ